MAELVALQARMKGQNLESSIPLNVPKENKFHSELAEAHQLKFQSKKERRFYLELICRKKAGEIRYFLRQVGFDLPGVYEDKLGRKRRARHFVDFGVCEKDGTMTWYEVKGRDLPEGKLKRVQVEEIYQIKIVVV